MYYYTSRAGDMPTPATPDGWVAIIANYCQIDCHLLQPIPWSWNGDCSVCATSRSGSGFDLWL